MIRVGNIIDKVMGELGLSERYKEQKSILYWEGVVGKRISEKTKPLYASKRKLVIEVENSTWMNELLFLKTGIIRKLNKELGSWVIDDILFLLKRG